MAALLEDEPLLARLAAGVFYAWNPYVGERLIIGQWALLLGYAGLPWVLRAVLGGSRWRLCLAVLPAVIGGFTALTVTALLAIGVALLTRSGRTIGLTAAVLAVGSLPWLVPSLLHPVYADPAGIAAFAARADTPFGTVGSLVMLGGMWNAQTVPAAYGGPWSALWLVIAVGAVAGYARLAWSGTGSTNGRTAGRWGRGRWPGLGIAAAAGLVIASAGVTAAARDLLRIAMAAWPGLAVLRDGQQFVAPLALAEAVGFGLLVARAMRPGHCQPPTRRREQPPACATGRSAGEGRRADRAGRAGAAAPRSRLGRGRPAAPGLVPGRLAVRGARHRRRPRRGRRPAAALGGRPQARLERGRGDARRLAATPVAPGDLE